MSSFPRSDDPLFIWLAHQLYPRMCIIEKDIDFRHFDKTSPQVGSCYVTALHHLLSANVPSWEIMWEIHDWKQFSQKNHPKGSIAYTLNDNLWPPLSWAAIRVLTKYGEVRPVPDPKYLDDSVPDSDSDIEARVEPYSDTYPDTDDDDHDYDYFTDDESGIGCNNCYACVSGGSRPCVNETE